MVRAMSYLVVRPAPGLLTAFAADRRQFAPVVLGLAASLQTLCQCAARSYALSGDRVTTGRKAALAAHQPRDRDILA
jgi:hypothetical protein